MRRALRLAVFASPVIAVLAPVTAAAGASSPGHAAASPEHAAALTKSASGVAQAAVRHASGPAVAARSVKAVLIHPWGGCSAAVGWADLASNWPMFGTTRLRIDSTTFCSSATRVTYAALVADHAKVLVFSDTAGGVYQLTSAEIAAITQYVEAGHNIVGTYLTFLWQTADNSALAPLFGLASNFSPSVPNVTPDYNVFQVMTALFRAVPNPYDSAGYAATQLPAGGQWNKTALTGAKYGAQTSGPGARAVITTFNNEADHYRAVYISNMPEYRPNTADLQFLYNALTLSP